MRAEDQERAVDELTFDVLRTLMRAHVFWGLRAAVHLPDLCRLVSTTEARLRPILSPLCRDGWIARDECADTVHLTRRGVTHFMAIQRPTTVEFHAAKLH